MAKRKLSQSQRAAIRKELAALLRTAKTKAEALRAVAKKYGITTITARWYAKTLGGAPAPRGRTSAPKGKAAVVAKPARAKRASAAPKGRISTVSRNGHSAGNGALGKVVAGIRATAHKAFERARLAKQLLPEWQVYIKKELSLRNVERKVRQELETVAKKARKMQEKIRSLTS